MRIYTPSQSGTDTSQRGLIGGRHPAHQTTGSSLLVHYMVKSRLHITQLGQEEGIYVCVCQCEEGLRDQGWREREKGG